MKSENEYRFTVGINLPNPETMCKGQCEGTGWIPIYCQEGNVSGLLHVNDPNEDQRLVDLWQETHSKAHTLKGIIKAAWSLKSFGIYTVVRHIFTGRKCDGWHFVRCPDCSGSGLEKGV